MCPRRLIRSRADAAPAFAAEPPAKLSRVLAGIRNTLLIYIRPAVGRNDDSGNQNMGVHVAAAAAAAFDAHGGCSWP